MKKPFRIGLALSGGGIKGLTHAGVLKALEEEGIKPDVISGVSAGGIVGALYADGHSPDSIASIFHNVAFRKMTKIKVPDGGFFTNEPFEKHIAKNLTARTFEELAIPLRIVATNLDKGESTVFKNGNLMEAVMASATVPVLFSPRQIDGEHYVDGGVLKNFPVSTIREECDIVIGVNASPLVADEYRKSVINIALRSYHFMFKANSFADKELCDYLIEPLDIGNIETFDSEKSHEIFDVGYQAGKEAVKNWRLLR